MKRNTLWRGLLVMILIIGSFLSTSPVKALGTPQIVSVDPSSSAAVGTCIKVRVKIDWTSDYGSMHVRFGNSGWEESSEVQFERTFCTGGYTPGTYQIRVEARSNTDNSWSNPNVNYVYYNLTSPPPTPTPPKGPNISIFDFSPSSAYVGDNVTIHIKVDSANPGATKLTVSCGGLTKNETSEVEFYTTWSTSGCPTGTATVNVLSRDVNDPNWANPSSATRSYGLSAPSTPVPSPTANFWADSNSILQGQCTNLHWDTANAVSVDIDGSAVNASGSRQVCPSVTQKFTLTAHAGLGGVDASRNLTVIVTTVTQPPAVVDSFQTGNVISIGGNIYVIVDRQRRHVPNPATLDALGIGRSLINNKGFSDSQLSQIVQGPDIPDVNIDPTGVASFREAYLPNLKPIVPNPTQTPMVVPTVAIPTPRPTTKPTSVPLPPTTEPTQQQSGQENPETVPQESKNWFCINLGMFCPVQAATLVNVNCKNQCVPEARTHRIDLFNRLWSNASTSDGILMDAINMPTFTDSNGQKMQVRVRLPEETPQAGDLIIWPSGCDKAWSGGGHIGYVTSGGPLTIIDSNWSYQAGPICSRRDGEKIERLGCMKFITSPFPAGTYQPSGVQLDKCSQYSWPLNWFCKWGWIK